MENENRPKRTLEPGTLDKTRKNIGPIDANGAQPTETVAKLLKKAGIC